MIQIFSHMGYEKDFHDFSCVLMICIFNSPIDLRFVSHIRRLCGFVTFVFPCSVFWLRSS